jgi:hypothetical protein
VWTGSNEQVDLKIRPGLRITARGIADSMEIQLSLLPFATLPVQGWRVLQGINQVVGETNADDSQPD